MVGRWTENLVAASELALPCLRAPQTLHSLITVQILPRLRLKSNWRESTFFSSKKKNGFKNTRKKKETNKKATKPQHYPRFFWSNIPYIVNEQNSFFSVVTMWLPQQAELGVEVLWVFIHSNFRCLHPTFLSLVDSVCSCGTKDLSG